MEFDIEWQRKTQNSYKIGIGIEKIYAVENG
jgi:hypothetical protein